MAGKIQQQNFGEFVDGSLLLFGTKHLRVASPKYQIDLEIAKKSNFFKVAQNEALRALVTKILF